MGSWLRLTLAVLATWRITHLLANEDGPAGAIAKIRALLGRGFLGKLVDCFYCLSLWVAAPAALFVVRHFIDWIFVWLALSGGACLLERIGREPVIMQPISKSSEGDTHHVLWPEAGGAAMLALRRAKISRPARRPSGASR